MLLFLVIFSICFAGVLAVLRLRAVRESNIAKPETSDKRIETLIAGRNRSLLADLDRLRCDNRLLTAANAAQDGYLSGLNVELRRSLGEIAGLTEGLLSDARAFGLAADQQDRIRAIADRNAGMTAMLDRVGAIAELSGAGFHVRLEPVDPRWIAHDVVLALKSRADARSVSVVLADRAACPPVKADPMRLRQMLVNLLTYVIHDTAPGSEVELFVEDRTDDVTLTLDAPGIVLSDGQIARLFQGPTSEFQADFDLIGTALALRAAEAMGGVVTARRSTCGGLRIDVLMPSARPALAVEEPLIHGANLMLVSADPAAAAALRRRVQPHGGRLFVAEPGDDPVRAAHELRPDAILIDAWPVAEALRLKALFDASALVRAIPVIGLVQLLAPGDERRAREVGFAAWTSWPLQPGEVRRVLGLIAATTSRKEAA